MLKIRGKLFLKIVGRGNTSITDLIRQLFISIGDKKEKLNGKRSDHYYGYSDFRMFVSLDFRRRIYIRK